MKLFGAEGIEGVAAVLHILIPFMARFIPFSLRLFFFLPGGISGGQG